MGLLDPYTVLDLTDERGLLAARMFADLGARVIALEPPSGSTARRIPPFRDPDDSASGSLYWDAFAAGKLGVTCDLDASEGQDLLRALCRQVDFVFDSSAPGTMAARGLGYEDLAQENPALVHVSITAFGDTGPKAGYADTDLIVWAAGGPLHPHYDGARPPLRISVPQAYLHAAADAAGGAMIAHFARVATGEGQHVEVSGQRSAAQCTLSRILAAAVSDPQGDDIFAPAPRNGPKIDQSGSGSATGRSKWEVSDGWIELHLAMGPSAGRFTNSLFAWLHEAGACDAQMASVDWTVVPQQLISGEISEEQLERMREAVGRFLAPLQKQEIMAEAIRRKLLAAPINTVADLSASAHLHARNFFETVDAGGARECTLPGRHAIVEGVEAFTRRGPAPDIGEHDGQIYGELLGLGDAELSDLRKRGVIA